jgi:hypothetical protein
LRVGPRVEKIEQFQVGQRTAGDSRRHGRLAVRGDLSCKTYKDTNTVRACTATCEEDMDARAMASDSLSLSSKQLLSV